MTPLKFAIAAIALFASAAAATTTAIKDQHAGDAASEQAMESLHPAHATLPTAPGSVIGAYVPGLPDSVTPLTHFESMTATHMQEVLYYSSWGEPFRAGFASTIDKMGAVPIIQIEPWNTSLRSIANGSEDDYLVAYANSVRENRHAVIISFAHEMNGEWYSWSYPHVKPPPFIAAWRHVVNVFREQGANNVTWLWTVNVVTQHSAKETNPSLWWPGKNYVTWVGISGYYSYRGEKFSALFDPTIADVQGFTNRPIMIAETGVAPRANQKVEIPDLFAGVEARNLLGLIWFDAKGKQDWRIDSSRPAINAFRVSARKYGSASSR